MKIYREITVVRQNKCGWLHFCLPKSSPAEPLLLLWGEGECCCLGMAAMCLHRGLGAGE